MQVRTRGIHRSAACERLHRVVEHALRDRLAVRRAGRKLRDKLLAAGLKALAQRHPIIGDVRGVGLMQGVEFVANRTTREPLGDVVHRLEGMAFSKGLLTLGAGKNVLRLAPPLVVDDGDVDLALEVLGESLNELD